MTQIMDLRRRDLIKLGAAALGLTLSPSSVMGADALNYRPPQKPPASLRVAFLYTPSDQLRKDPDAWWSWPGNEYDAEGRQKRYTAELRGIEARTGVTLQIDDRPVATAGDAHRLAAEVKVQKPDGLLLITFFNGSFPQGASIVSECTAAGIPVIFFVGLGVHHGSILNYTRMPGVYFIQAMDDFNAIESGLLMIGARKRMSATLLLSVVDASAIKDTVEPYTGIRTRIVPFAHYVDEFHKARVNGEGRRLLESLVAGAREIRGVTPDALDNALRAHLALKALLSREGADAVTMNCLRRGMLKPCVSFSLLNGEMIPATCENDITAAYSQILGQMLTGRPGFQHNPCYETERNHYYASHCTCSTKLHGAKAEPLPYLLRRFAHTNEGSCAIQVFWTTGDPVTMIHFYPGEKPALDVYAGTVVTSHPMPPAAGCTTNVEIELTGGADAMAIKGHHNILYCGDYARRFRQFANLYCMNPPAANG